MNVKHFTLGGWKWGWGWGVENLPGERLEILLRKCTIPHKTTQLESAERAEAGMCGAGEGEDKEQQLGWGVGGDAIVGASSSDFPWFLTHFVIGALKTGDDKALVTIVRFNLRWEFILVVTAVGAQGTQELCIFIFFTFRFTRKQFGVTDLNY